MNRHAQLHLPPLSPDQALVCVHIFERLITAIWRAHGPAMHARLDEIHGHAPPDPPASLAAPVHPDDLPF